MFGWFRRNKKQQEDEGLDLMVHLKCRFCDYHVHGIDKCQTLVDHVWHTHGVPSSIRLNGKTYMSGPENGTLRLLARLISMP